MPQNLESDFLKAAHKLKQKNRAVLGRKIGNFFLISAIAAGLVYLLFKYALPFSIGSIDFNLKILLLSILGLILIFGLVIYFAKFQAKAKSPRPQSSIFCWDFLQINRLKSVKRKHLLGFSLLLIAIVCQANISLFTNSFNDFITRSRYAPIPPSLTSPWSWRNHATIHPIVTSLTPDIEKSIKSVADYIAQQESDPYLRIKALYDYVISRVTYDLNVLKTGIRPAQDAQTVFSTRKAVCEGYANLFMALGREIGVDVVFIGGKIRQDLAPVNLIPTTLRLLKSNYDWTLHSWNAVKVAGNWQLVDTTWDDSNSDTPSSSYSADYLMPPPEVMITSHFPEHSDWQLLHHPKSHDSFEKQLILTAQFFIEKLQIISPTEYETHVQKAALIEVKKPPNYPKEIVALFAKRKESGFSLWSLPDTNPFTQENQIDSLSRELSSFGSITIAIQNQINAIRLLSEETEMRVLVIGATGLTGQQIVEQALTQGHEVTALVRNPDKFEMQHDRLQTTRGDVLDPNSLEAAVDQQQAVISSLGTKKIGLQPVTLFSEGTKNLLQAMEHHTVRRLVCITGIGAGDSKGHGGFIYDKLILPLVLKRIYDDKDRQEAEIRQSNFDWIIVRPGLLTNDPAKGNYRVLTDLTGVTIGKISRADVAAFALQQLTSDRYLHQTPLISD